MLIKGFKKASTKKKRRLIISVEGVEKTGKTLFGLSAPDPIAFLNMDVGTEGVLEDIAKVKDIQVIEFDYHGIRDTKGKIEQKRKAYERVWKEVAKAFTNALEAKGIETIVWDTTTEGWDLIRLAEFGKLLQVKAHHYGPVNAEWRNLIRKAYDYDKNVVLLHKMTDEYVNDKYTGNKRRAGQKDMGYAVQMCVRTWKKKGVHGLTILESRHDASLEGMELEDELSNFPFLASLVFPDTGPEDWE